MRVAASVPVSLYIILTTLLAVSCGENSDEQQVPKIDALIGVEADVTFDLTMRDISFDLELIDAKVGSVIAIRMTNIGMLKHDFSIETLPGEISRVGQQRRSDFSVHVPLRRDESDVLSVRVTNSGKYTYYCSVPGHRASGMEGILLVR